MPSAFVGKVAAQAGVSLKTAEVFWKEAKAAAAKTYDKVSQSDKFWGTVTKIFKRKANVHLGLSLGEMNKIMENFINNKAIDMDIFQEAYDSIKLDESPRRPPAPGIIIKGVPRTFWVVTERLGPETELVDIVYEQSYTGLIREGAGGLKGSQIVGIYKNQKEAQAKGMEILRK